jgi:hypothetical protein
MTMARKWRRDGGTSLEWEERRPEEAPPRRARLGRTLRASGKVRARPGEGGADAERARRALVRQCGRAAQTRSEGGEPRAALGASDCVRGLGIGKVEGYGIFCFFHNLQFFVQRSQKKRGNEIFAGC